MIKVLEASKVVDVKTFTIVFWVIIYFPLLSQGDNTHPTPISFTMRLGNQNFNKTNVTGTFEVLSGEPKYEAVIVKYLSTGDFAVLKKDDFDHATWTPFDGVIHLNLGPNDGVYEITLGLKSADANAEPVWAGTDVTLIQTKPDVVITYPTNEVVTQP